MSMYLVYSVVQVNSFFIDFLSEYSVVIQYGILKSPTIVFPSISLFIGISSVK